MNRQWAQTSSATVTLAVALAAGSVAWGQSPNAQEATGAAAVVTARHERTASADHEFSVGAIGRAAEANKYAFVFFFRDGDGRTQAMRKALESGVEEMSEKAEFIAVDVTDPQERAAVTKFGVSRAPMPLILGVAPTGAITKSWLRDFDARQLEQAFVSPGEAQCLKALQERKMVLVCVQNDETIHNEEAMQGVNAFKTERLYAARTAIVSVDPANVAEAGFLKKLRVSPGTEEAVTVLMAPPGRPIATFTGATNKAAIVAATKKAGSGCDPKSGCCPPKKKPAAQPNSGKTVSQKKP